MTYLHTSFYYASYCSSPTLLFIIYNGVQQPIVQPHICLVNQLVQKFQNTRRQFYLLQHKNCKAYLCSYTFSHTGKDMFTQYMISVIARVHKTLKYKLVQNSRYSIKDIYFDTAYTQKLVVMVQNISLQKLRSEIFGKPTTLSFLCFKATVTTTNTVLTELFKYYY